MADPEKRRGPTPPDPEAKGHGPDLQDLPQALHRFLELFNAREYWESHEVLEGPWREGGSDFYQGLILYAREVLNKTGVVSWYETTGEL